MMDDEKIKGVLLNVTIISAFIISAIFLYLETS